VYGLIAIARARRIARPTTQETPFEPMPAGAGMASRAGGAH
jgi:carbon starvation protein